MNLTGVVIGIISFLSIGLFHPVVIKAEYYFTKNIWPVFLAVGILLVAMSIFIENLILSAGLAIVGLSALWSIGELFQQEKRVEKGWFPKNPRRK